MAHTLQTPTSKDLYKILKKAAELHDGINTINNEDTLKLIVDIIPHIEQALEISGYELIEIKS